MTVPSRAKLVRESWALIMGLEVEVSAAFYERLFAVAPERAALFANVDMISQRLKFAEMITDIVRYAERPDGLFPDLKALADRHVDYHVSASDYAVAGEALLFALGRVMGERFTPEVRAAWAEAYQVTAEVMLRRHQKQGGK